MRVAQGVAWIAIVCVLVLTCDRRVAMSVRAGDDCDWNHQCRGQPNLACEECCMWTCYCVRGARVADPCAVAKDKCDEARHPALVKCPARIGR